MNFLISDDRFVVGVAVTPKVPEGWMLRMSIFDYPAAISPEGVEWIIARDGVLHEVKTVEMHRDLSRRLTGRTRVVNPPFGDAVAEDALTERRRVA